MATMIGMTLMIFGAARYSATRCTKTSEVVGYSVIVALVLFCLIGMTTVAEVVEPAVWGALKGVWK